jgi:hypothetical protein
MRNVFIKPAFRQKTEAVSTWIKSRNNFFVALQPNSGLGCLSVNVCRTHTHSRTHTKSILLTAIRLWQRPLTTQNIKTRKWRSTPSAGFELAILAVERSQTYALRDTATEIGSNPLVILLSVGLRVGTVRTSSVNEAITSVPQISLACPMLLIYSVRT